MGHIISQFLDKGINITGIEMSPGEVVYVNNKFASHPKFHGVKQFDGEKFPFSDNTFDLITCTECIEHVLDIHMDVMLSELRRVLKPDGIILFTTPNDEDTTKNEVCCPECGTIFHVHGHVRTFTTESLTKLLEEHEFKTIMCDGTDFLYVQNVVRQIKKVWISHFI